MVYGVKRFDIKLNYFTSRTNGEDVGAPTRPPRKGGRKCYLLALYQLCGALLRLGFGALDALLLGQYLFGMLVIILALLAQ